MLTKELILEYQRLRKLDPEQADAFAEANQHHERFYSLIQLEKQLVPALCAQREFILNGLDAAYAETDPKIREALVEHLKVETAARVLEILNPPRDDEFHDGCK